MRSIRQFWARLSTAQQWLFGAGVPAAAVAAVVANVRDRGRSPAGGGDDAPVPGSAGFVIDPVANGVSANGIAGFADVFSGEIANLQGRLDGFDTLDSRVASLTDRIGAVEDRPPPAVGRNSDPNRVTATARPPARPVPVNKVSAPAPAKLAQIRANLTKFYAENPKPSPTKLATIRTALAAGYESGKYVRPSSAKLAQIRANMDKYR